MSGLSGMEEIKTNSQKSFAKFVAAIPEDWLDNEKFSQEIFKKHDGETLTRFFSMTKSSPEKSNIISEGELGIFQQLNAQASFLEETIKKEKEAKTSFENVRGKSLSFEK